MRTLRAGDTVGVVATGFAVRPKELRAGVARLRRKGLNVVVGTHTEVASGYLAGTDEQRLEDLNRALRDPALDAIWFARGGYGTARLLPGVDWRAWRRHPRLFVGYSDLTALFAAADRRGLGRCVLGPVVTQLNDRRSFHGPSLRAALAGRAHRITIRRRQILAPGRASGRLVGGNLTVLSHLCGTRAFPDLRKAVLFLEDVGEPTYRVDRMLTQLRQAVPLDRVAGVLLGDIRTTPRRRFPPDRDLDDVLAESFAGLGVPVVAGLPAGHLPGNHSLPLGGTARIDTTAGSVELIP